jgi:hypothetical protein
LLVVMVGAFAAACAPGSKRHADHSDQAAFQPAPLLAEPFGCAIYAGTDRPDVDRQGLACLAEWEASAREYLAAGGKPTKYTSEKAIEDNRALARRLRDRLGLAPGEVPGPTRTAPPAPPAAEPASTAAQESRQAYLEGLVDFQKGDLEKARASWKAALKLDAANKDAETALAKFGDGSRRR